jgi:hypothetical protein
MAYMCNRMRDANCSDHESFCRRSAVGPTKAQDAVR